MAAPGANTILGDQNRVLPAEFRNMITNKATSLWKSSRYFFYQRTKKVKLTAQPPVYRSLLYVRCPWFGVQPALFRAIATIRALATYGIRWGGIRKCEFSNVLVQPPHPPKFRGVNTRLVLKMESIKPHGVNTCWEKSYYREFQVIPNFIS